MIENTRELVGAAITKMETTKIEIGAASEHVNAADMKTSRIVTLLLEFYELWIANDVDLAAVSGHVRANQTILINTEEDLRSIGATDDKMLGGMGARYKASLNLTEQADRNLKATAQDHETVGTNADNLRLAALAMREAIPSAKQDIETALAHTEGFLQLAGYLTEEGL